MSSARRSKSDSRTRGRVRWGGEEGAAAGRACDECGAVEADDGLADAGCYTDVRRGVETTTNDIGLGGVEAGVKAPLGSSRLGQTWWLQSNYASQLWH